MYYLTGSEVRTAIEISDELHQCNRSYIHLHGLSVQQNKALKYNENLIDTMKYNVEVQDSITDILVSEFQHHSDLVDKQLKKANRKRKWNAAIMYAVSGIGIVELGIILAR